MLKRKACPLLVQSDTDRSLTVEGKGWTRTYFLVCLGERCAAYRNGCCMRFGETTVDVREEAEAALSKDVSCCHGTSRRRNAVGEEEVYCDLTARWMNVTLGDCLGNCESEAALEGGEGE